MEGRIARIFTSFIDVPGKTAIAIVFSGCSIKCKGCHNPELWDPKGGNLVDVDHIISKINAHPIADYVVFWGGEPTDQMEFLINICQKTNGKRMALYTGREFEVLPKKLTQYLDLIICGPYRQDLQVDGGWPASSNQRILRKEKNQWIIENSQNHSQKILEKPTTTQI